MTLRCSWMPGERDRVAREWPEFDWDTLAIIKSASDEAVERMLSPDLPLDGDGRSEWAWYRLVNGDLIFGCFPQGDTYFEFEEELP